MSAQLLGRERELAVIDGLLESVADGGGSLLLRGEPGIGKSSLLDEAGRRAGDLDLVVLKAAGVPSEAQMAFAGLNQLLRPLAQEIEDLAPPQRDALLCAFGITNGQAPDIFLIALAALNALSERAATSPVVVLVEDAHWLDTASCAALTFVARRVQMEPIVVLLAARDGADNGLDETGLQVLTLQGLDASDAGALLDSHAPHLAPHVRRRLLDTARGNPLALLELPRSVGAERRDASMDLAPLPISDRLERAFLSRVSELPQATRTLLLVAALDDGGGLPAALHAASTIEGRAITVDELSPAEEARLVGVEGGELRFRHPLVRAAIHQAATTAAQQHAHTTLADTHAQDADRSVFHRAASLASPDEQVASDLEAAAGRAMQRGAAQVAASALERAAQLTADPARRGTLLVRAAEMEFELGRSDLGGRLLARAKQLELSDDDHTRMAFLVETYEDGGWSGATRIASFVDIANRMTLSGEPGRALEMLQAIAFRCWWGNPDQDTRDAVVAAAERIPRAQDTPARLAILAYADPVTCGAAVIDRISRMTPDPADPLGMYRVGAAANSVWAYDLALPFLASAVDGLRAQGRLGLLAQALVFQAWAAVHLAREVLALAAAEEGTRLARETGQPRWATIAQLAHATIAAERGDVPTADALLREAEAMVAQTGANPMLALVQFVRGRGAVAHQRYSEGVEHLERVLEPSDAAYQPFVGAWGLSDLVEATAHSGRPDRARGYLGQLESLATATRGSLLRAEVGYARPMVADDAEAEAFYQAALQTDLAGWPCYRGRMLLWYGRWLRRKRRVAESRAPLRAARDGFDALAFPALAELARQELRASGETSQRRTSENWDRLTPQELQIGHMAAAGLSNRQIGEKLYLSHRTIGSHLYRIFPKLGITSRSELRDALDVASLAAA